jgi:hypothetical protein
MNFKEIYSINVNDFTEKKNGLTYLSWAHAWKCFVEVYPKATYKVIKDEYGKSCFGDSENGYMVYTNVTVEDLTHEMWLPVMDFKNKSMMNPTTFDVNKAIMRCLTKNLAMFGLGLYIYAGEDIPNESDQDREIEKIKVPSITETLDYAKKLGVTEQQLIDKYNANMGEKEQITKFIEISDSHRLALYKLLQKQEKAKK